MAEQKPPDQKSPFPTVERLPPVVQYSPVQEQVNKKNVVVVVAVDQPLMPQDNALVMPPVEQPFIPPVEKPRRKIFGWMQNIGKKAKEKAEEQGVKIGEADAANSIVGQQNQVSPLLKPLGKYGVPIQGTADITEQVANLVIAEALKKTDSKVAKFKFEVDLLPIETPAQTTPAPAATGANKPAAPATPATPGKIIR